MSGKILLCTDLDRTLIPNGAEPESPTARERFAAVAARPEVVLAYATGRHRELVASAIEEYDLPRPCFVIADVGTTIYEIHEGAWRSWPEWIAELELHWGPKSAVEIRRELAGLEQLALQEDSKQGLFKISYYGPGKAGPWLEEVEERLGPESRAVFSQDDAGHGLLDVLPATAGKLAAIGFLRAQLEIELGRTVFAGDSGNDLEVLASEVPAVLVANATEALQRRTLELAAASGQADRFYLARGDFRGMNGNYSAGILEGLVHFLPEAAAWFE